MPQHKNRSFSNILELTMSSNKVSHAENQAAALHTTTTQSVPTVSPHGSNGSKKRRVTVSKKTPAAKGAALENAVMNSNDIDPSKIDEPQANSGNNDFVGEDEDQENQVGEEGNEMDEPDWKNIMIHDPARTDVPVFLDARDRRDAADLRFSQSMDELNETLKASVEGILAAAAEIHQMMSSKLDQMEDQLKDSFEMNEEARAAMEKKLQESADAAQGLFANLLMRVSQPFAGGKKKK